MKKKLVEITLSVICVSVVCVICIRTFTTSSLLGNNMLLIENIEALKMQIATDQEAIQLFFKEQEI